MKKEKQQTELLHPVNKDAVDQFIRRSHTPWSLGGFLYRIQGAWRVARMKKVLKALLAQQEEGSMNYQSEEELEPPWVTMPGYPMGSMAWKMGAGEDVNWKFQKRYRALSENSQENFRRQYPEPERWQGFYSLISITNDEYFHERK